MLSLKNPFARVCALMLLPGLLVFGLAGCGGDSDEGDGSEETSSVDGNSKPAVKPPPVETAGGGEVNENSVASSDTTQDTPPFEATTGDLDTPPFTEDTKLAPRENWMENFELAKAKAQKEGKDLLMDFTGSDWCGWCIRLDKEVFRHKEFEEYVADKFVLVELDFPNDKSKMTDEIIKQNDELQVRFEIEGFPTIILADAEGRPYARTGYQAGGAEVYTDHLTELRAIRIARDEAFKEAEGLEGIEKAKKIDEGLETLPPEMVFAYYKADVDQIIALDADNAGGLKGRYENKQKEAVLQKRIKGLQQLLQRTRSPARVLVELEKALEEFAEEPQSALKLNLLKIEMLTYEDRHEDVLKVSDGILQVEGLEAPVRFQALVARLQSLDALKRSDEALALADKSIADFAEFPDQQITFFLAKATFQKEAGNIKEARTTVDAAKKVATPRMKTAIDRFAKAIFADVPETETPDTGKPEAPAAGDAGASEESGDAAKGDDAAKENDGAE